MCRMTLNGSGGNKSSDEDMEGVGTYVHGSGEEIVESK